MRLRDDILIVLSLLCLLAIRPLRAEASSGIVYDRTDGLSSGVIFELVRGPQGDLWAGTIQGLGRFDGRRWDTPHAPELATSWITALATDTARDRLWFGSYGDGLYLQEGSVWERFSSESDGLPSNWITALTTDAQGRLWVGTLNHGLAHFDGAAWRIYDTVNSSLPFNGVDALAIDAQGAVWVGLAGHGLCRVAAGEFTCHTTEDSGLPSDHINALLATKDGELWIGTDAGLAWLDTGTGNWRKWTGAQNRPNLRIFDLALDPAGRLWVGTGSGLFSYDGEQWVEHTAPRELDGQVITALEADVTGHLWAGTAGNGVVRLGAETVEETKRRPVVLVHGWRGPASDRIVDSEFRYLRRWLEADGYPVFYATNITADNTLHENARQLKETIDRAKALTGAKDVDVIAFSMGGLNTRTYIESTFYEGDVHQAFIMGTPHVGVTMWKTFLLYEIAAWSDEPSARELLPEQVRLFNATHGNNWDVPYILFAGAADAPALPVLFELLPPSDGLISAWSAHALVDETVRYVTTPDLHAWSEETMLLEIPSFLWPSTTYFRFLRPLLQGNDVASQIQPPWSPLSEAAHSPLFHGEIAPGATVTHTLPLDTLGTHRIYARWQGGIDELELTLTAPDGTSYDPEATEESARLSHFALDFANFASYVVTTTETESDVGIWTAQLTAPKSLRAPTGYAMYAVLDSSVRLDVTMNQPLYELGEAVVIRASLTEPSVTHDVGGLAVEATVYTPDHRPIPIPLYDDGQHHDQDAGDGVYGNVWEATGPGGYYPLFLRAASLNAGQSFARGCEDVILVSPDSAYLLGSYQDQPYDLDRDGGYETLAIEAAIGVKRQGEFVLSGQLTTIRGKTIGTVARPVYLSQGLHRVSLPFAGSWIRAGEENGPYVVRDLVLLDASGAQITIDRAAFIVTDTYSWRAFEDES